MWSLTITNPKSEPVQIKLVPGKMLIGRMVTSDIVINDVAASRRHAEIYFDSVSEVASINDLNSSNGTYVNRHKITGFYRLQSGDVIRIGQTVMYLTKITNVEKGRMEELVRDLALAERPAEADATAVAAAAAVAAPAAVAFA